ncbi:MAG: hypothetical protein EOP83_04660 [Verrucomicrobiaceae bacterium]|nr:MAG: hypothetical protein EOP83_04660 [Verrucomicrobiaceae bacterium]
MDQQQIDAFIKHRFGWMTPTGSILACDMHDHLVALRDVPEFREAVAAYETTVANNAEWMANELDSLGDDDHPEMHRFDGMDDDAKELLTHTVYAAGWVRLGYCHDMSAIIALVRPALMRKKFDEIPQYVEAEGLAGAVDWLKESLTKLSWGLGCRLVSRRMEYQNILDRRKRVIGQHLALVNTVEA